MNDAVYIEVRAGVLYWEDATVNGKEDRAGDLIPLRKGDSWCPVIRLADGVVMDWPAGTTADVSYKVCDDGEYWLLDADRKRIAKWADYYVPGAVLCQDGGGYGDYIIVVVGPDGTIRGWNKPSLNPSQWNKL